MQIRQRGTYLVCFEGPCSSGHLRLYRIPIYSTTYRNAPIYYPGEPCEYCSGSCNDGLCTAPAQLPTVCDPGKAPGGLEEGHAADNKPVIVVVQILKKSNLTETTTVLNKENENKMKEDSEDESDDDDEKDE